MKSCALFLTVLGLTTATVGQAVLPIPSDKPFNRVIAVVDVSRSYQEYIPESWAKLQAFVDTVSSRRPSRWEGTDDVEIISLDAAPVVVWAGTAPQLKQIQGAGLTAYLKPRMKAFSHLTDVRKAINLAIDKTNQAPRPAEAFVLIFSDLMHEEAGGPPAIPPVPPPGGIRWAQVDTAQTTFYALFVPDDQGAAWREHLPPGVKMTFKNPAESRNTALVPPPPVRKTASAAEVAQTRETLKDGVSTLGMWISWAFWTTVKVGGGIVALVMGAGLVRAAVERRRRAP